MEYEPESAKSFFSSMFCYLCVALGSECVIAYCQSFLDVDVCSRANWSCVWFGGKTLFFSRFKFYYDIQFLFLWGLGIIFLVHRVVLLIWWTQGGMRIAVWIRRVV